MKKLSSGFIVTSIIIFLVFGYFQGIVVPKVASKYAQEAAIIKSQSSTPSNIKKNVPCNPQLVKCGAVRIRKNTIPDNYQDFTFTHNIPGYSPSFTLDDDATLLNPSATPNIISFLTPYSGLFTITENISPEFDTSISCLNANTGDTQTVNSNSITINQTNGHTYSCVVNNKSNGQVGPSTQVCNPQITKCGTIKIIKDTVPDNYQDFAFTHNVPGYNPQSFTLDDDGSLSNPSTLSNIIALYTPSNGTFNISEEVSPDFETSITCTNYQTGLTSTVSGNSIDIPIVNNSNVSCVFKNEAVESVASCTPNTWTQKADYWAAGRYGAVGFSIGNKGYLGTGSGMSLYSNFGEYDPSTDAWTQKASFPGPARWQAVGFSIGNKGYLGTGSYNNGSYQDFYEYDPPTDTWTQKANVGGGNRSGASYFSINNKGYVGMRQNTYTQDFWRYDPVLDTWSQVADFIGSGRAAAVGFAIGDKGYVGTGITGGGPYGLQDFYEYNSFTDTWTQKASFGGYARRFAAGFSLGDKGYIGTGFYNLYDIPGNPNPGGYYNDFWEYNSLTDTWTQKADFPGTARYGAVGFSLGNKGYIGTGFDGNTWKRDFYEYCP